MSDQAKFRELLEGFSTAVLITRVGATGLRARPMAIAEIEPSCVLWFITADDCAKVHEIKTDTHVSVVCQKDHSVYLSLSGRARLEKGRSQIDRVWKESFKVWFPEGKDDPNLTLIRVEPEQGEYWDNHGLRGVQYLLKAAGAYLTGTRPHIEEGEEHGTVKLG